MNLRTWLAVVCLICPSAGALASDPYTWTSVGPMGTGRSDACAVLLQDGRALVIGGVGSDGSALSSAEFFNNDQSFSPAPALNTARAQFSCSLLSDGRVLAAGGTDGQGNAIASAEIFDPRVDPSMQAWQMISNLNQARWDQKAVVLQDGRVLLAGGCNAPGSVLNTLELFDPVMNQFSLVTGMLSSPRKSFAAALLPSGQVLLVGGSDGTNSLASTDIFDPASGMVIPGANLMMPRMGLTANTLLDGTVLIVGGNDGTQDLASAEIYDPVAMTFSYNFGSPTVPRSGHLAFVIPNNGNVLIVGGMSNGVATASCELYTFQGGFMSVGSTSTPRAHAAGVALGRGMVLTAGGSNDSGVEARSGVNLSGFFVFELSLENNVSFTTSVGFAIQGSGFQPGEIINSFLTIGNGSPQTLSFATADSKGGFSSLTYLSNETSGLWTIHAVGQASTSVLTAAFPVIFSAVNLNLSCNPCALGPVTITATAVNAQPSISSGSVGPGHNMSFYDGNMLVGNASVIPNPNGSGTAIYTAALPAGSHQIYAIFAPSGTIGIGPDGFIQSASVIQNVTVNQAATAVTLSSSANSVRVGSEIVLTAKIPFVTGIPPTGTVTFTINPVANSGFAVTAKVDSTGTATLNVGFARTGTYPFTATYSGDSNYVGNTSSTVSVVVSAKIAPTINLSAGPNPARANAQVSLTATFPVTSGNPAPTGTVSFFDGTTQLGSATISSDGLANLPTTFAATGTHSITAVYAGDSNYLSGTSAAVSLTVNPNLKATVIGNASPNPFTLTICLLGTSCPEVTFTAVISYPAGSPAPTGTVTFRVGSTGAATAPISAIVSSTSVKAVFQVRPSSMGSFTLTATYNGDNNYNSATSAAFTLVVN